MSTNDLNQSTPPDNSLQKSRSSNISQPNIPSLASLPVGTYFRVKIAHKQDPADPNSETELNLSVNDLVELATQVKEDKSYWIHGINRSWGVNNGLTGFFPAHKVTLEKWDTSTTSIIQESEVQSQKIHDDEDENSAVSYKMPETIAPGTIVKVHEEYKRLKMDELELVFGATVTVIEAPEGGWWRGTADVSGEEGWFPASNVYFMEVEVEKVQKVSTTDIPHTIAPGTTVVVKIAFERVRLDEISLTIGELIVVLEAPVGGRWRGMKNLGAKEAKTGWFPASNVSIVPLELQQKSSKVETIDHINVPKTKSAESNKSFKDLNLSREKSGVKEKKEDVAGRSSVAVPVLRLNSSGAEAAELVEKEKKGPWHKRIFKKPKEKDEKIKGRDPKEKFDKEKYTEKKKFLRLRSVSAPAYPEPPNLNIGKANNTNSSLISEEDESLNGSEVEIHPQLNSATRRVTTTNIPTVERKTKTRSASLDITYSRRGSLKYIENLPGKPNTNQCSYEEINSKGQFTNPKHTLTASQKTQPQKNSLLELFSKTGSKKEKISSIDKIESTFKVNENMNITPKGATHEGEKKSSHLSLSEIKSNSEHSKSDKILNLNPPIETKSSVEKISSFSSLNESKPNLFDIINKITPPGSLKLHSPRNSELEPLQNPRQSEIKNNLNMKENAFTRDSTAEQEIPFKNTFSATIQSISTTAIDEKLKESSITLEISNDLTPTQDEQPKLEGNAQKLHISTNLKMENNSPKIESSTFVKINSSEILIETPKNQSNSSQELGKNKENTNPTRLHENIENLMAENLLDKKDNNNVLEAQLNSIPLNLLLVPTEEILTRDPILITDHGANTSPQQISATDPRSLSDSSENSEKKKKRLSWNETLEEALDTTQSIKNLNPIDTNIVSVFPRINHLRSYSAPSNGDIKNYVTEVASLTELISSNSIVQLNMPESQTSQIGASSSSVVSSGNGKWSDGISEDIVNKLQPKERMRQTAIWELIYTERDYIRDLKIIVDVFMKPFIVKKITTMKNIDSLFSNIEQLLSINEHFLQLLEERRAANPIVEAVGDIFVSMEIYKTDVCRGLNLASFLIKPVQRICKYPLLLKEITKYTDEMNDDYEELKDASEKMHGVISIINEGARQADTEGVRKVVDIQNSFTEVYNFRKSNLN
ncbi:cytochrome c oxidase subunit 1 [Nowakowskiella sp. JEL0078]|nr:cytochrome c oxidase subunit 1 [Nowakowskiella sp. JEL0078]